jgi:hypothetical protein
MSKIVFLKPRCLHFREKAKSRLAMEKTVAVLKCTSVVDITRS